MDESTGHLHALILAGGASSRLGQPKQLVKLGGRPALHRVVTNAISAVGQSVTVVLGAHAQEITRLLAHSPASMIVNRHWEEGIASSLRCGLAALPPTCTAALILLGDQVAVSTDDLRRLTNAWRTNEDVIAASVYQGHLGVPAIFPQWSVSELRQLRGDRGARMILERYAHQLTKVHMPSAAVDLDTPEDLERLTVQYAKPGVPDESPAAAND